MKELREVKQYPYWASQSINYSNLDISMFFINVSTLEEFLEKSHSKKRGARDIAFLYIAEDGHPLVTFNTLPDSNILNTEADFYRISSNADCIFSGQSVFQMFLKGRFVEEIPTDENWVDWINQAFKNTSNTLTFTPINHGVRTVVGPAWLPQQLARSLSDCIETKKKLVDIILDYYDGLDYSEEKRDFFLKKIYGLTHNKNISNSWDIRRDQIIKNSLTHDYQQNQQSYETLDYSNENLQLSQILEVTRSIGSSKLMNSSLVEKELVSFPRLGDTITNSSDDDVMKRSYQNQPFTKKEEDSKIEQISISHGWSTPDSRSEKMVSDKSTSNHPTHLKKQTHESKLEEIDSRVASGIN